MSSSGEADFFDNDANTDSFARTQCRYFLQWGFLYSIIADHRQLHLGLPSKWYTANITAEKYLRHPTHSRLRSTRSLAEMDRKTII